MNSTNADVFQKIERLTQIEALRMELETFLDYLAFKYAQLSEQERQKQSQSTLKIRGIAKGKITIAADFDAPMEDFEAYMPKPE